MCQKSLDFKLFFIPLQYQNILQYWFWFQLTLYLISLSSNLNWNISLKSMESSWLFKYKNINIFYPIFKIMIAPFDSIYLFIKIKDAKYGEIFIDF